MQFLKKQFLLFVHIRIQEKEKQEKHFTECNIMIC